MKRRYGGSGITVIPKLSAMRTASTIGTATSRGRPAEPPQRNHQPGRSPDGENGEIAPRDADPVDRRVVGVMQGVREVLDGEHLGDVAQPRWDVDVRHEDAGDEVQRKRDR